MISCCSLCPPLLSDRLPQANTADTVGLLELLILKYHCIILIWRHSNSERISLPLYCHYHYILSGDYFNIGSAK